MSPRRIVWTGYVGSFRIGERERFASQGPWHPNPDAVFFIERGEVRQRV